jgi:type I restriction enzyme, S subunit
MISGWFDHLPAGWQRKRIKTITPVLRGASPRPIDDPAYFDDDGEYAWVRISDVTASSGHLMRTTQRLSSLGASKSVKLGRDELFLSIAGSVGKPCITGIKACIHDGFVYFPHLPKASQQFLFYIFDSGRCFSGLGKLGTQLNLNTWTVGNIEIPFPDIETQKVIAAFLKRETGRIDHLIAKKQQMLDLLAEKRRARATVLVTRGLNPSVKMSPTGMAYLAEAPSHWRVRRIASLYVEADEMGEEGLPVLSVSINWGISDRELGDEDRHRIVNQIEDKRSYKRVRPGDLVYNMMRAWQGAFGVTEIDGLVSPAYVVARPKENILSSYFEPLLRTPTWIEEFRRASKGIADFRQRLYWEHFRQVSVVLPPWEEQVAIAEKVKASAVEIARLLNPIETSLDLLREFRSSLITAAVTGQIDVKAWSKRGISDHQIESIEAGAMS